MLICQPQTSLPFNVFRGEGASPWLPYESLTQDSDPGERSPTLWRCFVSLSNSGQESLNVVKGLLLQGDASFHSAIQNMNP